MTEKIKTGALGEQAAARHLENLGYRLLERNFKAKSGEIDIIAQKGMFVVFVEVKTRKSGVFGRPSESVTSKKQQKIKDTALEYMQQNDVDGLQPRFDVAEVFVSGGETYHVEIIENAF